MPTTIEGITVVTPGWRTRRSALRLADLAGRRALERCGCRPKDVDLLVNAGLYHDRNLGEPALAPLIQQDIGANPEDPYPGGSGTFSFDVANGSCGVLTAVQIADGFLRAGTIHTALVVASDADPGHGLASDFPFYPAGAAIVCRWVDDGPGVGPFVWCNQSDGGKTFRSTVRFEGGRNVLAVERDSGYPKKLAEAAAGATRRAMEAGGLSARSADLVLMAPAGSALVERVAAATGIGTDRFMSAPPGLHTAGLIAVLEQAQQQGRLEEPGRTVLVVAAGAGVTAGAAIYRT